MSLEGCIRELGLPEVCQLLGLGHKTGTLAIRAPLDGIAAEIVFAHGAVVDAATWPMIADGRRPDAVPTQSADRARIESCVLSLLTWTDGEFRFIAADASTFATPVLRVAIGPLLVEAAQRAEVWERVRDRIPNARAVPAFVGVESKALPLLKLVPQEWEILTCVDGQRDLAALAAVLGHDLLEIVQVVHGLIAAGVLTLRVEHRAPRRHDTPPSNAVHGQHDGTYGTQPQPLELRVATDGHQPSPERGARNASHMQDDCAGLCLRGDDAARRGDLEMALACWTGALGPQHLAATRLSEVDADRVREAIALTARLHALLYPPQFSAPTN